MAGKTTELDRDPLASLDDRIAVVRRTLHGAEQLRVFDKVTAAIDRKAYMAARSRYAVAEEFARSRGHPVKYFDVPFFLIKDIAVAFELGLHESTPLRILDIGAGPCCFAAACAALGHSVLATDVDFPADWSRIYTDIAALLGFERAMCRVRRRQPVPVNGKFDLITAHRVTFDLIAVPEFEAGMSKPSAAGVDISFWSVEDWIWFIDDVTERLLNPGGRVHIWLNPWQQANAGTREPQQILDAFESRGARVDRKKLRIIVRKSG